MIKWDRKNDEVRERESCHKTEPYVMASVFVYVFVIASVLVLVFVSTSVFSLSLSLKETLNRVNCWDQMGQEE